MKQVYRLESFADIEKAFCGVRSAGDDVPIVEEKAMLHINGESLTLDSQKFVLSESLRCQGKEFVLHCIAELIGKQFSADKIRS